MLDEESPELGYYQVPKANLKNIIVRYDEIVKELDQYWSTSFPRYYEELRIEEIKKKHQI